MTKSPDSVGAFDRGEASRDDVIIPDNELAPVVLIGDELRRHHDLGGWPIHCKCGESTFDYVEHAAAALMLRLSGAGYHVLSPAELLDRVEYNAHDFGELGRCVRVDYLRNFIADAARRGARPGPKPLGPATRKVTEWPK